MENNKFIFVSYAHVDKEIVLPLIIKLQERFDVWYDKGITVGKEWVKEITNHLEECSLFIFMVSKNSIDSPNCQDEIAFAKAKRKPFINVLLEDFELPSDFMFSYGRFQMYPYFKYKDINDFIVELDKAIDDFGLKINVNEKRRGVATPLPTSEFTINKNELIKYNGSSERVVIPNGINIIGIEAFKDCSFIETIEIPQGVHTIKRGAFNNCSSLKNINLPEGISEIPSLCFSYCKSLKTIIIPEGVNEIGSMAFYHCSSLESVTLSTTLRTIGSMAFSGCSSLYTIMLYEGLRTIGYGAFEDCSSLPSITIPESVVTLGNSVFYKCNSLRSINIPKNVSSLGGGIVSNCRNLNEITVDDNNDYYKCINGLVYNKYETELVMCPPSFFGKLNIQETVKRINERAFYFCEALTEVVIPYSTVFIDKEAFGFCSSLKSVTVGKNVASIGDGAFRYCKKLKTIINQSNLDIKAGSDEYGEIGKFAEEIIKL